MPFTPFHMGPGIAVKALLHGSFSLMVFGWAQIVMDIQPLIVMISGEGHLHGFSHTYIGASLLGIFSALTGKYLSELGLFILTLGKQGRTNIAWKVCFISAFIGTFSHVLLDSIMHADVEPFFPFTTSNHFLKLIPLQALHTLCLSSGLIGTILYVVIYWLNKSREPLNKSKISQRDL